MDTFWQWHSHGGPVAVGVLALAFAFALVVLVLWVALPFAVFGTKRRLHDLLEAQRETNRRLAALEELLSRQSGDDRRELP